MVWTFYLSNKSESALINSIMNENLNPIAKYIFGHKHHTHLDWVHTNKELKHANSISSPG